ncbi:MAG: ATP-dependent 6-phosphofructokinase [Pirellulales bacterium]|nr:ATP-dependent 6-phosphofructokinase [Pirellulales bacterium]
MSYLATQIDVSANFNQSSPVPWHSTFDPMAEFHDFDIRTLGECQIESPVLALEQSGPFEMHFVEDAERIVYDDRLPLSVYDSANPPPALELAGPRKMIHFRPETTRIGIVTCGGLCPGLNDVIRGLVMTAYYRYGVRSIHGFQYGYRGMVKGSEHEPIPLDPEMVSHIHENGGTILGASRGPQDADAIVDQLQAMGINVLFTVGGDGTLRGAMAISAALDRRGHECAIVGVPKTIDNDVKFIDQSFGFETAYSEAVESIFSAHMEAEGAYNGIGLVKLMGRHSGFIACHAAMAASHVNFVLIPEVPFQLEGERGLLNMLRKRLQARQHAVIVVSEGAGQDLFPESEVEFDKSGNRKLLDIGEFLQRRMRKYFTEIEMEHTVKYIDPSYIIRSVPTRPPDSVYCWRLAQNAVHAAMCGKTEMVVGSWHGRLVHVPMKMSISERKQVDPSGDLWLSVLESTGQPSMWE